MQNLASLSFLALTLTFAGSSFAIAHGQVLQSDGTMAQPQQADGARPHKAPNAAHQLKHMTKQLGLTADQTAKIQPILADRDARMATLHNDTTIDPRTMHKQGHAIELDTQSKVKDVLTPAQLQLYTDMLAAHHKGGPAA